MWHEARRQERKIRGMIVDYRKRAERRQDFYEKIKADPTQFIQLHGRKCKIHLDPAVAAAGDGAAIIVPWQGQQDNLIDRFDVRAHLDYIAPVSKSTAAEEINAEERQCNYERYRILAQNDFLNLGEEKFLHQLHLEEQYGANAQLEAERSLGKKKQCGVAIAYSYDDADSSTMFSHIPTASVQNDDDNESVGSEIDMDVSIDISKLDTAQAHELNACGRNYGMLSNDFYSYLTKDVDEADAIRLAREEEQEKMMLSGRKSRRERRAQKERRVAGRPLSPPSYAAKEEPLGDIKDNDSDSRSPSPENSGKITYITSFGGEDELQPHSKILINMNKPNRSGSGCSLSQSGQTTYAQKVKENLERLKQANDKRQDRPKQYQFRGRSRSYSRHRRSSSRNRHRRSRSRSRGRRYRRTRSRSRRSRSRSRRRRRYSSSSRSSSSLANDREAPSRQLSRNRSPSKALHEFKPSNKYPDTIVQPTITIIEPPPPPLMIQYPTLPIQRNNSMVQSQTDNRNQVETPQPLPEEPPPIKRYYGRKRPGDSSDSDEETADTGNQSDGDNSNDDDEDDIGVMDVDSSSDRSNPLPHSTIGGGSCGGPGTGKQISKISLSAHGTNISSSAETKVGIIKDNASGSKPVLNPRERLKRKMQILLNKQYKADKKAEIEKTERQLQQQQEREDEMRELALKLRRRQRELRHKCGSAKSSEGVKSSDDEYTDVLKSKARTRSRSVSESSRRSVKSIHNNDKSSGNGDRVHPRSSPIRRRIYRQTRTRSPSQSRSRSSHMQRRRYSRSSSQNRRSISRRRYRSRDRSRYRDHRDRGDREHNRNRNRYPRSKSRSKSRSGSRSPTRITGNRYRNSNHNFSSYSRNYDRQVPNQHTQANEIDKHNRNRIVISAPPKLKKLVDY